MEKESQMNPVSNTNNPNPATARICIGCGHDERIPLRENALACCPDHDYRTPDAAARYAWDLVPDARAMLEGLILDFLRAEPVPHPSPGAQADDIARLDHAMEWWKGVGDPATSTAWFDRLRPLLARETQPEAKGIPEDDRDEHAVVSIRTRIGSALREIAKRENPGKGQWIHMGAHSQEHWREEADKILALVRTLPPESETAKPTEGQECERCGGTGNQPEGLRERMAKALQFFRLTDEGLDVTDSVALREIILREWVDTKPTPSTPSDMDKGEDRRCLSCGAKFADHADTGVEPGSVVCPMTYEESQEEIRLLEHEIRANKTRIADLESIQRPLPPVSGTATEAGKV